MKITIVGAGKVGYTVAGQLTGEGHSVTLVEKNEDALNIALSSIDVAAYLGSGVNGQVLQEAQTGQADLFIALTGSDEQNLLGCLIAKKLGAKNTIARIRQPEYNNVFPLITEDLGLSMYVNPELQTALEISRILEFPLAKKVEPFAQGRVEMIDYDVDVNSPMCGKLVKDAFANMHSALVCAVERAGEVFIPLGDFRFQPGDVMTIISPVGNLSSFFKESGVKQHCVKNVIISGGGRTSFYLAQQLLRQRIRVCIIEQDLAVAQSLADALPDAEILTGDGTSQSVLEEKGISDADAFCCLTGIDEENILAALYAKHISPSIKTVTKINRVELIPMVKPLGIGSIVSPKLIAADRVVSYVRAKQNGVGSGVLTLYRIIDNKAEAIEFEVSGGSKLIGIPIRELKLKSNVILGCIISKGKICSPRGNDTLRAGDSVIIVTTHTGFDVLDDILRG